MSERGIPVVRVESVEPWPNADKLEMVRIGGYQCAVAKGVFLVGDLAVYIEPDELVPTACPLFEFLKQEGRTHYRISARRLRGTWSEGLLVMAPPNLRQGDDARALLGIVHYEPPAVARADALMAKWKRGSNPVKAPETAFPVPVYDLEPLKRYPNVFAKCESVVVVTEKIHGCNARFVFDGKQMHLGSRQVWRRKPHLNRFANFFRRLLRMRIEPDNWWASCLRQHPWIEAFCRKHPNRVLWGEIYGPSVQGAAFSYGLKGNELGFKVFDVYDAQSGFWFSWPSICCLFPTEQTVPEISAFAPENMQGVLDLIGGYSTLDDVTIQEGVVLRAAIEERHPNLPHGGRMLLKVINPAYLALDKE